MNAVQDTSTGTPEGGTYAVAGGHAIVSFAREWQADEALRALVEVGFGREIVYQGNDAAVVATIAQDLTSHGLCNASWLERAQLDFSERGRYWLVLRTRSDGRAFQIADCVTSCGATSVQYYGNLIVEELLTPRAGPKPRRGLHALPQRGEKGMASLGDAASNDA